MTDNKSSMNVECIHSVKLVNLNNNNRIAQQWLFIFFLLNIKIVKESLCLTVDIVCLT